VDVVFDRVFAESFVKKQSDRYHLRKEECSDVYRNDGIEGSSGANVDQCQEKADECADQDRVEAQSRQWLFMIHAPN